MIFQKNVENIRCTRSIPYVNITGHFRMINGQGYFLRLSEGQNKIYIEKYF